MTNEYEEKKKIIQDLILSEGDIKLQLQRLVKNAKPFLSIEDKTGRVLLKQSFPFKNAEKIVLFMVGKYFAFHAGIIKENTVKLSEIGDGLGIAVTTLSAPMARLVKNHVIEKPQKDSYNVNSFHVEKFLESLRQEYSQQTEGDSNESK